MTQEEYNEAIGVKGNSVNISTQRRIMTPEEYNEKTRDMSTQTNGHVAKRRVMTPDEYDAARSMAEKNKTTALQKQYSDLVNTQNKNNSTIERSPLLDVDTDALQKEIDVLSNRYDELEKNRRNLANTITSNNITKQKTGKGARDWKLTADDTKTSAALTSTVQKTGAGARDWKFISDTSKNKENEDNSSTDDLKTQTESADKLHKELAQKKAYLNQAKIAQSQAKLTEDALKASDFKQYSERGKALRDNNDGIFSGIVKKLEEYGFKEATTLGQDFMTDEENAILNYYLAKDEDSGTEQAEEYMHSIQQNLNARIARNRVDKMGSDGEKTFYGLEAGVERHARNMANFITDVLPFGEERDFIPNSVADYTIDAINNDLAGDGSSWSEKFFGKTFSQMMFDFNVNGGNMLPSIAASLATGGLLSSAGVSAGAVNMASSIAGNTVMGASVGGEAYKEMINLGYDHNTARIYAGTMTALELGLGEALGGIMPLQSGKGIDGIINKFVENTNSAAVAFATKLAGNMASEFTEEYLQEFLEPAMQNLFFNAGNDIQFFSAENLYAGLLGAASAGLFDVAPNAIDTVNTSKLGKNLIKSGVTAEEVAKVGNLMSVDSAAYRLAGKINAESSAYSIGRLFTEENVNLSDQNKSDLIEYMKNQGVNDKNAKSMVNGFSRFVERKQSELEGFAYEESQYGDKYVKAALEIADPLAMGIKKIIDDNLTVYQRTQAFFDIQKKLNGEVQQKSEQEINARLGEYKLYSDLSKKSYGFSPYYAEKLGTQGQYEYKDIKDKDYYYDTLKSTGERVYVKEVVSKTEDGMKLRLTDGRTVNSDEISFGSNDLAIIFEAAQRSGIAAKDIVPIVNTYDGKIDGASYIYAANKIYGGGTLRDKGYYSDIRNPLNTVQTNKIFALGKAYRDSVVRAEDQTSKLSAKAGMERAKAEMTDAQANIPAKEKAARSGPKYSIRKSADGGQYVEVIPDPAYSDSDARQIAKSLFGIVKNKYSSLIDVGGQKIGINKKTAKEWQRSRDASKLYNRNKTAFNDKMNAFENADELLKASKKYVGEGLKHVRGDNFTEFARGEVDFKVGDNGYTADIIVGTTDTGEATLYDIVKIKNKKITGTAQYGSRQQPANTPETTHSRRPAAPESDNTSAEISITQSGEEVNKNDKKIADAHITTAQDRRMASAADNTSAETSISQRVEKINRIKANKHVVLEGKIDLDSLSDFQLGQMDLLGSVAEAFKIPFYFYQSIKEGTRFVMEDGRTAPNGYYQDSVMHIDVNAGNNGSGVMLYTAAHEITHFMREWSAKKFDKLARFLVKTYNKSEKGPVTLNSLIDAAINEERNQPNGRRLSVMEAYEEVVADAMHRMFLDTDAAEKFSQFRNEDSDNIETHAKLKGHVHKLLRNLREAFAKKYDQLDPESDAARELMKMEKAARKISRMFKSGVTEAARRYGAAGGKLIGSETNSENIRKSVRSNLDYNIPINEADIKVIRDIGTKKSINSFSSEEIQKTAKWAHKFYEELGTKSPFFRSWFGDWRAYDTSTVKTIPVSTLEYNNDFVKSIDRGTFFNSDSGWDIITSNIGINDTVSHSGHKKISAKMLSEIRSIIENAVLFDTETSLKNKGKKHNDTAFMHKLYSPVTYDGKMYIAKISVEEYGYGNGSGRRFYNLQGIEMTPAAGAPEASASYDTVASQESIDSIADLFSAVKRYDKDFSPKAVNPELLNPDGTPRVFYHGTREENGNFTVFDETKAVKKGGLGLRALGKGNYFTSVQLSGDERYGSRVIPVYLNLQNPLILDGMPFDRVVSDTLGINTSEYSHDEIQQMLRDKGYDGVIQRDSQENIIANVFDSENIKSATDNIGTFDRSDPDIRYSRRSTKNPELLDPRTVTENDVREMLKNSFNGEYDDRTYIPVRTNTPQSLIYWAEKRRGDVIDDNPIIMSVKKIYQAMSRSGADIDGCPHEFSADDIISIIRKMNDPEYIVYQEFNDRYAEVVKCMLENGKKAIAVLEIGNNKDVVYMNNFEGGLYNVLVTTYPPNSGEIEKLVKNNQVIYDKKKDASQRTSGSTVPSVLNDTPFYEDSITQPESDVNRENIKLSRRTNPETREALENLNRASGELREKGINPAGILEAAEDVTEYYAGALTRYELQTAILCAAAENSHDINKALAQELVENNKKNFVINANSIQQSRAKEYIKKTKFLLTDEVRNAFGSDEELNRFIDEYKNRIVFSDKDGTDVTDIGSAYVELNDIYGYSMFPTSIEDSFGQLMQIARVVDTYIGNQMKFTDESYDSMVNSTALALDQIFKNAKSDTPVSSPRDFLLRASASEIHSAKEYNALKQYRNNVRKAAELETVLNGQTAKIESIKNDISAVNEKVLAEIERLTGETKETAESSKKAFEKYQTDGGGYADLILERQKLEEQCKSLEAERRITETRLNAIDGKITELEVFKPLKDIIQRQKADTERRINEIRQAKKAQRSRLLEVQKKLTANKNETVKAEVKKEIVRHDIGHYRGEIVTLCSRLSEMLVKPTKARHIPENMRTEVADILDSIGVDEKLSFNIRVTKKERRAAQHELEVARYELENAQKNKNIADDQLVELQNRVRQAEEAVKNLDNPRRMTTERMGKLLDGLHKIMNSCKSSNDPGTRVIYDENFTNYISELSQAVNEKTVAELTIDEIISVRNVLKGVVHRITNGNNMFAEGIRTGRVETSSLIEKELAQSISEKKHTPRQIFDRTRGFAINNLEPLSFFDICGSETLRKIGQSLIESEDIYARDIDQAYRFFNATYDKYTKKLSEDQKKQWNPDRMIKVSFIGRTESYTLGDIMAIYATYRRTQGKQHLLGGGVTLHNKKAFRIGRDEITGKIRVELAESTQKNAYTHTEDEVQKLTSELTKEQKEFAVEMDEFLSTVVADWGNEVTMAMYGFRNFTEENYFPIKVDRGFAKTLTAVDSEGKKHMHERDLTRPSFAKPTVDDASGAIEIGNFFDVWAQHVHEMATYHAFARGISDLRYIRDCSVDTQIDHAGAKNIQTVRNLLDVYGGKGMDQYLSDFISDVAGGTLAESRGKLTDAMYARFKKGAVLYSLSSAIQQPTSVCRAMAMVAPKYFAESIRMPNRHTVKTRMEEMKKYAPVAILKEIGGFDTGIGRSATEYLVGRKSLLKSIDSFGGALMERGDNFTWRWIWEACKREQAEKSNLPIRSEELLRLAGKRFSEVIRRTQVYDSPMSKSAVMRSSGGLDKLATSFAAEPTKTANMLFYALRAKEKGERARYIAAVVASIALGAAAKSLPYAMRDDDDDRTLIEKYVKELPENFIGDLNPLTLLPYVRDLWSIAQGYDVERGDIAVLGDLIEQIGKLPGDTPIAEKLSGFISALCGVAGIPAGNIIREIKAVFNFFISIPEWSDTTWQGITNAALQGLEDATPAIIGKMIEYKSESEKRTDRLYDAIVSSNSKEKRRIEEIMGSEDKVNTAIKNGLRRNDARIAGAALDILRGDYRKMKDTVSEITSEKNFTAQQISDAVYAEKNAIERRIKQAAQAKIDGDESGRIDVTLELKSDYRKYFDSTTKAQDFFVNAVNKKADELKKSGESAASEEDGEGTSYYTPYKAYQVADKLDSGDVTAAAEIAEDIVQAKIESGKTEKEARASVRSSVTRYFKPLYQAAYKNRDSAEMTRIRKLLMQSKLYGGSTETSNVCRRWTEE